MTALNLIKDRQKLSAGMSLKTPVEVNGSSQIRKQYFYLCLVDGSSGEGG